jgi:F0F1-type ATP synthase membrane subunit c/vacuolar-type H+-ATPase subunit K
VNRSAARPLTPPCVSRTPPASPDGQPSDRAAAERQGSLFYTVAGLLIAGLVFAGYAQSYYLARWSQVPARAPELTALIHVHALSFTGWILLGVVQPWLVQAGNIAAHRRWGTFGAGLAFLVWALGNWAAIEAIHVGYKGWATLMLSTRSHSSPSRHLRSSWLWVSGSGAMPRRTSA